MTSKTPTLLRRLAGLALLATLAGCARAEPPTPLLWRVSDADNSLYLLGSFHLLRPGDYPLHPATDAAFADAERLVFELPPAEMDDPSLGQRLAAAGRRADGRRLQDELPAPTWSRLEQSAARLGLPVEALQGMEPWFASLVLSLTEMQQAGLDASLGLDRHFLRRAAEAGKPGEGLETGDDQIALFDGMDPALQRQALEDALEDVDGFQEEIERLHALWRQGDAEGLFAGSAAEMREKYPSLYRRVNADRNRAWLPRLKSLLDDEASDDALVVVGAMHLLGEDGVVALLRAEGYTVERLGADSRGQR